MICRCGYTWDTTGECDYSRNECGPKPIVSSLSTDGKFQIELNSKAFGNGDILDGKVQVEVIGDPVQKRMLRKSRWWIVDWWRKLTKTEKYESNWVYTVKIK